MNKDQLFADIKALYGNEYSDDHIKSMVLIAMHEVGRDNNIKNIPERNWTYEGVKKYVETYSKKHDGEDPPSNFVRTLKKLENGEIPKTAEAIFNEAYKNSNGNKGGTDGFDFRGRSYVQATGRKSYQKIQDYFNEKNILAPNGEKMDIMNNADHRNLLTEDNTYGIHALIGFMNNSKSNKANDGKPFVEWNYENDNIDVSDIYALVNPYSKDSSAADNILYVHFPEMITDGKVSYNKKNVSESTVKQYKGEYTGETPTGGTSINIETPSNIKPPMTQEEITASVQEQGNILFNKLDEKEQEFFNKISEEGGDALPLDKGEEYNTLVKSIAAKIFNKKMSPVGSMPNYIKNIFQDGQYGGIDVEGIIGGKPGLGFYEDVEKAYEIMNKGDEEIAEGMSLLDHHLKGEGDEFTYDWEEGAKRGNAFEFVQDIKKNLPGGDVEFPEQEEVVTAPEVGPPATKADISLAPGLYKDEEGTIYEQNDKGEWNLKEGDKSIKLNKEDVNLAALSPFQPGEGLPSATEVAFPTDTKKQEPPALLDANIDAFKEPEEEEEAEIPMVFVNRKKKGRYRNRKDWDNFGWMEREEAERKGYTPDDWLSSDFTTSLQKNPELLKKLSFRQWKKKFEKSDLAKSGDMEATKENWKKFQSQSDKKLGKDYLKWSKATQTGEMTDEGFKPGKQENRLANFANDMFGNNKALPMILKGAIGAGLLKKATKKIDTPDIPKISAAFQAHINESRRLSKTGFTPEEEAAAKEDLNQSYNLGLQNVLRASAGDRARYLAGSGMVDASRQKALVDFAAKDAELNRQNRERYANLLQYQDARDQKYKTLKYQQEFQDQQTNKVAKIALAKDAISSMVNDYEYGQMMKGPQGLLMQTIMKDFKDDQKAAQISKNSFLNAANADDIADDNLEDVITGAGLPSILDDE